MNMEQRHLEFFYMIKDLGFMVNKSSLNSVDLLFNLFHLVNVVWEYLLDVLDFDVLFSNLVMNLVSRPGNLS